MAQFSGNFEDLPEPLKEQIRKNAEMQQMMHLQNQEVTHSIVRMMEELPEDHFRALLFLINAFSNYPHPSEIVSYYQGYLTQLAYKRFNTCPGCGQNHDAELAAAASAPVPYHNPATADDSPPIEVEVTIVDEDEVVEAGVVDCWQCDDEKVVYVCPHPPGTHGQELAECPEPSTVACPFCVPVQTLESWDALPDSPCHPQAKLQVPPGSYPHKQGYALFCSECGAAHTNW